MDWHNLPDWLKMAGAGALSAIGTIILGFLKARSDDKRTRTDDRGRLTDQMLNRLHHVEEQLGIALETVAKERAYCDERMAALQERYEAIIVERDKVMNDLETRLIEKNTLLKDAVERIKDLEHKLDR